MPAPLPPGTHPLVTELARLNLSIADLKAASEAMGWYGPFYYDIVELPCTRTFTTITPDPGFDFTPLKVKVGYENLHGTLGCVSPCQSLDDAHLCTDSEAAGLIATYGFGWEDPLWVCRLMVARGILPRPEGTGRWMTIRRSSPALHDLKDLGRLDCYGPDDPPNSPCYTITGNIPLLIAHAIMWSCT